MEDPCIPRSRPVTLRVLCVPGYSPHDPGRCPNGVEDMDATDSHDYAPFPRLCSAQVWRGRHGCTQVSDICSFHGHVVNLCFRSLRPLVIALVPGQQRTLDRVKDMREKLANELADVINEYGPEVFEDFNEVNIISYRADFKITD